MEAVAIGNDNLSSPYAGHDLDKPITVNGAGGGLLIIGFMFTSAVPGKMQISTSGR